MLVLIVIGVCLNSWRRAFPLRSSRLVCLFGFAFWFHSFLSWIVSNISYVWGCRMFFEWMKVKIWFECFWWFFVMNSYEIFEWMKVKLILKFDEFFWMHVVISFCESQPWNWYENLMLKSCYVMNFSMGEKGQNIKNWTNI